MDDIYTQWRASLIRPKQKKRTYEHFDKSLDLDRDEDFALVVRAVGNLGAHQFLPFLKFIKKDIRYRKDELGTARRDIKPRPIMYASHLDAHIYGFFSYLWSKEYERFIKDNGSTESVIAYRKIVDENGDRNKGNIQFAREVFQYIQKHGDCVAIVADISKFFDTLKHKTLKERLCAVLGVSRLGESEYKVLRSLTAFRSVLKDDDKRSEYVRLMKKIEQELRKGKSLPQAVYECGKKIINTNKTEVGIPQGSPASGLLANIYLSAFDATIRSNFPDTLYRRYSDDIVVVCPLASAETALTLLQEEIKKYALKINPEKAFFVKFERQLDGLPKCIEVKDGNGSPVGRRYIDYLGSEFDGRSVLLRNKTLQRSYRKADKKIHKYHARQKKGYKHKTHRQSKIRKGGSYLKNAANAMRTIGSKIDSQKEKYSKFLRRSKKSAKGTKT